MRTLEDTAVAFARACRRAGIPFAVVGGFAVSTWGQPRTTSDVDVLLHLAHERDVPALVAALSAEGLSASPRDVLDTMREGGHVTIFDEATSFHVDAKITRTPQERAQIADAVEVPFHGDRLRVVRAEDTIAYKLLYGTDQDVKDARGILVRQEGRLDAARLEAQAARLGVLARLRDVERDILDTST